MDAYDQMYIAGSEELEREIKVKPIKQNFRIFQEKPGVISKDKCWVCICGNFMYINDTLEGLINLLNTEWENDKHLIGYADVNEMLY